MNDQIEVFEVVANLDEIGDEEEFSWDLVPLVNSSETIHLDPNGLPKLGTIMTPGMIMIGKIGKSKAYPSSRKPTALEIAALSFQDLRSQFGHLWIDSSLRVPSGLRGKVVECRIDVAETGRLKAIVEIEVDP